MKDLKMTSDGEFVIGPNGDFETVDGDEAIAQQIVFILKTQKGDWTLAPRVGANLERFIGKPNTREVRDMIEAVVSTEIINSQLVYDPTVTCIQLSAEEVFLTVEFPSVEDRGREVIVTAELDLKTGNVSARSAING